MARISFKAKIRQVYYSDDSPAYRAAAVPVLQRKHCDMPAFRKHPKFGGLANSDLFPNVLARIRRDVFGGESIRLDRIPAGVTVDESGFLATISAEV
jgi:hypothetical protein